MNHKIIYLFFLIFTLTGCGKDNTCHKLEKIDHLLSLEKNDTAYSGIKKIKTSELKDRKDSAYYYLLDTQILYRLYKPIISDSMIEYSINYYKNTTDQEKLSRSYYYKGVIDYDLGKLKDAVANLKRAEYVAYKTNNAVTLHNIYEGLSLINNNGGEIKLAMKYTKYTLHYAYLYHNKNWLVYALNNAASIYEEMGMEDSAVYYATKCIPLLKYIPKSERIYILTTIGSSYIDKNRDLAKHYLDKSISIYPYPSTYSALATIYAKEGNNSQADLYWHKALKTNDPELKREILKAMFENKYKEKDFKEACDLSQKIISINEQISRIRKSEQVKDTQMKYDNDMEDAREKQLITNITVIAFILGLIAIMIIVYSKYRSVKSRNEIMQNQILINSYAGEINRLKDTESHESQELTKLKQKLDNLQKRQGLILANGHRLYQDILSGGTTATWHKDDFISFIEYYRIQNLEYVLHLEKDYDSLSQKNEFFKILHHLGKSDEDISKIMVITPTTVRVTKKRIKERARA